MRWTVRSIARIVGEHSTTNVRPTPDNLT